MMVERFGFWRPFQFESGQPFQVVKTGTCRITGTLPILEWLRVCSSICRRRDPMKRWPNVDVLAGSIALVLLSLAVPWVLAAPPTPESSDAGVLRAPEPSPKRG